MTILVKLISGISYNSALSAFGYFLSIGGYAVVCFALVTKKRNILLTIGFASIAVAAIFSGYLIYDVIAWIIAAFISAVSMTEFLAQYREKIKKLWLIPAVFAVISIIATHVTISNAVGYAILFTWDSYINWILNVVDILLAMIWVTYPDGFPQKATEHHVSDCKKTAENVNDFVSTENEAYCSLVKHILLLLFTFGIWSYIWIYRMTRYANEVKDEEYRNPTNKLLLCMFVPFYSIYWTYKTAQRIDKMAATKGISSDMATLCLILAIFVPIIPPILLQDKVNNIVTTDNTKATTTQKEVNGATIGAAEELKRYKELLDSGVISQEEFEAKKKQLLGL